MRAREAPAAWAARLALCLAPLLLPALAWPQTASPREAPEGPAEKEKRQKPRVTLDFSAEETYESNVPYAETFGISDYATRGTAQLTAILPIRRGQVELGAEAGANVYREVKGLDRYTWGFLGGLEHRFNRRSELRLQARSSHGYSRDNPRIDVAGALPPLALVRNDSAEGSYRHRLGRAVDLLLEGRGEVFRFDLPQLQDGWSAGGRFGVENSFSQSFALGAEVGYGRTATADQEGYVPGAAPPPGASYLPHAGFTVEVGSALATVRWRMAKGVVLRAEGGVARFGPVGAPVAVSPTTTTGSAGSATGSVATTTGEGGTSAGTTATGTIATNATIAEALVTTHDPVPTQPSTTPTVAANLSCNVGKHTLTAIASRRIEQTYGVGAIGINSVLALEYRLALARWATFLVHGADNHNAAPDGFLLSRGRSLTTGFDCALPADFTIRLTYAYWDRQDPERDWRSHTVAAGLTKRFTFR